MFDWNCHGGSGENKKPLRLSAYKDEKCSGFAMYIFLQIIFPCRAFYEIQKYE